MKNQRYNKKKKLKNQNKILNNINQDMNLKLL